MARNLYGCTSADFTLTESGRVVAGATATVWTARTGGTQITDLTDLDGDAITSVTSDADGGIRFYGVDGDKDAYWLDTGTGARIAVRPVDLTGETGPTPELTIGTVATGTAAATITGTAEDPVLNLTLPTAGANGVNTAAIQDSAVTAAKLATSGRFNFPAGASGGYGFASGAVHLSGTGSPEGVVTAAPGSTWLQTDATTDVKGWIRWVKATGTGNTGWVAGPEADTGRRAIAIDGAGWSGTLNLRRIGNVCTLYTVGGATMPASGLTVLNATPTGFKPVGSAYAAGTVMNTWGGNVGCVAVTAAAGVQILPTFTLNNTKQAVFSITWDTTEAWPTSLP